MMRFNNYTGQYEDVLYTCTFINKDVEEDNFEQGCDPKTRRCIMQERVNIAAPSLKNLIEKLNDNYYLTIKDIQISEGNEVIGFSYSRTENESGDEASEHELKLWKTGRIKLWVADYYFSIEKRIIQEIKHQDFKDEGIKFDN